MLKSLFYRKDDCAKEYKIGDVLGTGSFATVKRATCRKEGTEWAVKCIDKAKLDKEDEEALKTEVAILEQVDHTNIVRLRQVFDCPKVFYMVMECMTGGELFDRIVEKSKYSEAEAAVVVRKIVSALVYCHARGIVHRDLKPENLLYTDKTDAAEIKIADFGLAKLLKESDQMATACGTPGYVAPEILKGEKYSDKVDLWSVGVILYILLCGFPPFYDENNAALFEQIKSGTFDFPSPYWDDVSDLAKDLVRRLLVTDPKTRLSAEAVLTHKWITGGASTTSISIQDNLRRMLARRKFKGVVKNVMAANRMQFLAKARSVSMDESLHAAAVLAAAATDAMSVASEGEKGRRSSADRMHESDDEAHRGSGSVAKGAAHASSSGAAQPTAH